MRLEKILSALVAEAPGAIAAILADWEGEAVVIHTADQKGDYQIKFVGAHQGIILDKTRELLEKMQMGKTRCLAFVLDNFNVVTAPVNSDYYLVLTLQPRIAPILAKPALKKAVIEIERDIA